MKSVRNPSEKQAVIDLKDYLYRCQLLFVKMTQSPFLFDDCHIEISREYFHFLEFDEVNQLLKIYAALQALDIDEQSIVFYKYLRKASSMDFEIQNRLAMSERTYYRKKKRALTKLAIALHLLPISNIHCSLL